MRFALWAGVSMLLILLGPVTLSLGLCLPDYRLTMGSTGTLILGVSGTVCWVICLWPLMRALRDLDKEDDE